MNAEHSAALESLKKRVHNSPWWGVLADPTHTVAARNPSCGDVLTCHVRIANGRCDAVAMSGSCCLLSKAAVLYIAERLHGQPVTTLDAITEQDLCALVPTPLGPTRKLCLMLALELAAKLQQALRA